MEKNPWHSDLPSITDLEKVTGVSGPVLQYWVVAEVLRPIYYGRRKKFDVVEFAIAVVLADLYACGLGSSALKIIAEQLRGAVDLLEDHEILFVTLPLGSKGHQMTVNIAQARQRMRGVLR